MAKLSRYLDPESISHITPLEIKAKYVVEGFIAGMHKSPYRGFAVEFAQHREYTPGDEVKHIDWKVYGRTGRYYIKQYEEETNFIAHILHDASESMRYGSTEVTKFEYANLLTCCISYLILNQQDAVGVTIFDNKVRQVLEPKSLAPYIHTIARELEASSAEEKTSMGPILHDCAERTKKRGLIFLVSDLFNDPDEILEGIQHFRFLGHEVILFHILDPYEITFPFEGMWKFEGLEGYDDRIIRPKQLRRAYLTALERFVKKIKDGCLAANADYIQVDTSKPVEQVLIEYLGLRKMI